MIDVFISYPHSARAQVEPIRQKLVALGLDVFFDSESIGAEKFSAVIDAAVRQARVVLGCWSSQAFKSTWVMNECRVADRRNVLVPVAIERFDNGDIFVEFNHLNYFDLSAWDGSDDNEEWRKTLRALGKHLGKDLARISATAAAVTAKQHMLADFRETWERFPDKDDKKKVRAFHQRLKRKAPDSGIEFEVLNHLQALRKDDLSRTLRNSAVGFWRRLTPTVVVILGELRYRAVAFSQRFRIIPRSIREVAIWFGWTTMALMVAVVAGFDFFTSDMPSTDELWNTTSSPAPIDLATVPLYTPQAFLAIEDKRYFHHLGIDLGATARATFANLRNGRLVRVSQTIDQQLVPRLFPAIEHHPLRETATAIWLETVFTKEEILSLFLSRVELGRGTIGLEAASRYYFGRPPRELTLLQAATLASFVRHPPPAAPMTQQDAQRAKQNADRVLVEMVAQGYISEGERRAALSEWLIIGQGPIGPVLTVR